MFKNNALDLDDVSITSLDSLDMQRILSAYKWVILFNYAILLLTSNALIFGFYQLEDEIAFQTQLIVYAIVNAVIILLLGITLIGFKYRKYALRDHDIVYESGWLIHNQVVVPYNRLQYVNINQGLLMRKLGLGTIVLHTAGNDREALKISGLDYEIALKIKTIVADKMATTFTNIDDHTDTLNTTDNDGI